MSQRRAYPRNAFERHGIIRSVPFHSRDDLIAETQETSSASVLRSSSDRDKTPRHIKEGIKPSCVVVATKRIGFGATEMKMSQSMTLSASDLLIFHTTRPDQIRYRVNIYLKHEHQR